MARLRSGGRGMLRLATVATIVLAMLASLTTAASADGTESLGAPSIPIAAGTGVVAAGTGTFDGTPADIELTIPAGVTIAQVLLYWEGQHSGLDGTGSDDTISAAGNSVTGTLIGGPTFFFNRAGLAHHSSTYRADITGLGLVAAGTTNTISIDDIDFDRASNGAGILVITDDGGAKATIDIRDGNDLAFRDFLPTLDTTVPQTMTFDAATIARTADLVIFASSVAGPDVPTPRPNKIEVTVGETVLEFFDVLGSVDGNEWDTVRLDIPIPAGETSVTVQVLSVDEDGTGERPSSLAWNNSTLTVPAEPTASLGDFVWKDLNRDGIQDGGEPGVADVTVNLWTAEADGTPIAQVDTQDTGANGEYRFDGLTPGQPYVVQFIAPDGMPFTLQGVGDDATDSDADPTTGITGPYVLASGEYNDTVDAGVITLNPGIDIEKLTNGNQADGANDADVPVIAIGGDVTWTYLVTNTGEIAYQQAEVVVTDDIIGDVTAGLVAASDDGADGVLSPGEVWTYEATGTADDLDNPSAGTTVVQGCNPDGTAIPGARATYANIGTVTVPGDTDSDPSHYCNPQKLAALGDFVWKDLNRDGIQDGGEPGVADVTVNLWTAEADGTPIAQVDTQDTGLDGSYLFEGLTPGQPYVVQFIAPDGMPFTLQGVGDDATDSDADPTTGITGPYVLAPGETDLTADAGIITLNPGIDIEKLTNGNQADGANDANVPVIEPGDAVTWTYLVTNTGEIAYQQAEVVVTDDIIGDVTSALVAASDDGADGVLSPGEVWTYEATGTAEDLESPTGGTIVVQGCNPDGTHFPGPRETYENIGTVTVPGDTDSDPSHYCNPQPRAALGDFVWKDTNGDGIQDAGEMGIADVTVNLWTAEADGTPIAQVDTQQTGANGGYLFTGLTPGQPYVVQFVAPDGMDFTLANVGDDATDSDADPTTGITGPYVLAPGETNLTADAGIVGKPEVHIHVEHEDMWLKGYKVEHIDGASNGKGVKGKYRVAKASWMFNGEPGVYEIMTDYWDENDGEARFFLYVNNVRVDYWKADQDLGSNLPNDDTKVRRSTVDVELRPGDKITWYGKKDRGEYARLDMTWIWKTGEIPPKPPKPPVKCEVQTGHLPIRGVEVHSYTKHYDKTYNFYDRNRNLIHSTPDLNEALGERGWFGNRYEREWEARGTADYEPKLVYYVSEFNDHGESALKWCRRVNVSPIGLDLDGSNVVERISGEFSFDIDGDGAVDTLGEWFAPTEGILINNTVGGEISGLHLFGDQGGQYADGFEKLALLDANGDGAVAGDELNGLAVWVDADSDAAVDQGEVQTLADHGIVSLSTAHTNMVSQVLLADGTVMVSEDLWFPLVAAGVTSSNSMTPVLLLGLSGLSLIAYAFVASRRRRKSLDDELAALLEQDRIG